MVAIARLASIVGAFVSIRAWVYESTPARLYESGELVEMQVNRLMSPKTHLGFDHYSLRNCRPEDGVRSAPANLGERLAGQLLRNAAYTLRMKTNATCLLLCVPLALTRADVDLFVLRIDEGYRVNWMLDGLPAATTSGGVPIGGRDERTGSYFVYNHARITVRYHDQEEDEMAGQGYAGVPKARIVGFEVQPLSVQQLLKEGTVDPAQCDNQHGQGSMGVAVNVGHQQPMYIRGRVLPLGAPLPDLLYSYDVFWTSSPIEWASRWDVYLGAHSQEHWFSVANSLVMSLILFGAFLIVLKRSGRQNGSVETEDNDDDRRHRSSWRLIQNDVFRPPNALPGLFVALIGFGSQLLCSVGAVLVVAAAGYISPANRGSLLLASLLAFCLTGGVAGYVTARAHRMFNGGQWTRVTQLAALGLPGIFVVVLLALNALVWTQGAVDAAPFGSVLVVLGLWLLVDVPLVFIGAYFGFVAPAIEPPVCVSALPREVPPQPWYQSTPLMMAYCGVVPFGSAFLELHVLLRSVWQLEYYGRFGVLLLQFGLLVTTSALLSVVATDLALRSGDYRWWWRSLLVPAASGGYIYGYGVLLLLTSQPGVMGAASWALCVGYMGLVALAFSLLTGAAGCIATYFLLRRVYAAMEAESFAAAAAD